MADIKPLHDGRGNSHRSTRRRIDPILSITTKSRLIMTSGHPENYTQLDGRDPHGAAAGNMRPFRQIAPIDFETLCR